MLQTSKPSFPVTVGQVATEWKDSDLAKLLRNDRTDASEPSVRSLRVRR